MSLRPHVSASIARRLESLEDRNLLSAHGFGPGPAGPPHQAPGGGPPAFFAAAVAIAAGTSVNVGSLTGEFAVPRGHFGGRFGHRR
jgi:hypothetical protein